MNLERITQPMTDAVVERPLTLIEKLEDFRDTQTYYEATFADAVIDSCIDIVKQHTDWVPCSDRLPTHSDTYPAMADGRFGIAKFDAEYKAWLFKNFEVYELMANVTHWQEKPQPPSEVQA